MVDKAKMSETGICQNYIIQKVAIESSLTAARDLRNQFAESAVNGFEG